MAEPKEDPQGNLFDRTIDDMPEIITHLRVMQANRDAARAYGKAKKQIDAIFATLEVNDGDRIRFTSPEDPTGWVIPAKGRSGGGFEVPQWAKVTAGKVTKL